jgi:tetratricopeptide (TPR) repeat protein
MRILAVSLDLALVCVLCSPQIALAGEAEWKAHMDGGAAALRRGDYRSAAARFEAARKEAEPYGASDKRLLVTLFILAHSYSALGRHAEADRLYRQVILSFEKTLGPDHPEVASALNDLAELYRTQGRYAEAEPLYQRSLGIREKTLGPGHPDVAATLNGLALLYQAQGLYAKAEPLYRRALAILEKTLGPEHPHVAIVWNNLAELNRAQGRGAEADALLLLPPESKK